MSGCQPSRHWAARSSLARFAHGGQMSARVAPQGQVHERAEGRVSLHTSQRRVADIVARAKREHPYEVPGVSARPIIDGNPDYLAWIAKATSAPKTA